MTTILSLATVGIRNCDPAASHALDPGFLVKPSSQFRVVYAYRVVPSCRNTWIPISHILYADSVPTVDVPMFQELLRINADENIDQNHYPHTLHPPIKYPDLTEHLARFCRTFRLEKVGRESEERNALQF
ncbi:hypothetical protein B0O80DRAFT_430479 [Mortierella sp. GBAus27b]|nr:hypothetical protein B0O80DRAFT_430479 [Mortierella sp. GBAus27b]